MDPLIRNRTGLFGLVAAAALLAAVWWVLPNGSPPLYDGLSCVANPYAYLSPPPNVPTLRPEPVQHTLTVQGGTTLATTVFTSDLPPQAQLSTDDGSLVVPAGARSVTVDIHAVPPPPALPTDGRVDGNFYSVTASADNGATVAVNPAKPVTLTLRTTDSTGQNTQAEVIERLDGDHWTRLTTVSGGGCAFLLSATVDRLGTFVLVIPPNSGRPTPVGNGNGSSGGSAAFSPVVVIVAALVLLTIIVLLLRLSRTSKARSGTSGRRKAPPPRRRP